MCAHPRPFVRRHKTCSLFALTADGSKRKLWTSIVFLVGHICDYVAGQNYIGRRFDNLALSRYWFDVAGRSVCNQDLNTGRHGLYIFVAGSSSRCARKISAPTSEFFAKVSVGSGFISLSMRGKNAKKEKSVFRHHPIPLLYSLSWQRSGFILLRPVCF